MAQLACDAKQGLPSTCVQTLGGYFEFFFCSAAGERGEVARGSVYSKREGGEFIGGGGLGGGKGQSVGRGGGLNIVFRGRNCH